MSSTEETTQPETRDATKESTEENTKKENVSTTPTGVHLVLSRSSVSNTVRIHCLGEEEKEAKPSSGLFSFDFVFLLISTVVVIIAVKYLDLLSARKPVGCSTIGCSKRKTALLCLATFHKARALSL